jgi:PAS domain S-box-containing protein
MKPPEKGTKAASAGPRNDTYKRATPGSLRTISSLYVVSFLILAAVVVGFIWHDLRAEYRDTLAYWNVELSSSAEARVRVVTLWWNDRRMDLGLVARNPLSERLLSASGSPGGATATQRDMERELEGIRQGYGYLAGAVLDSHCRIAAQVGIRPEIAQAVNNACQWLYPGEDFKVIGFGMKQGHLWLTLAVPVFAQVEASPHGQLSRSKIGAVVMVTDPWKDTIPLIAFESTPTRTSETLFVWQDANQAFIFSPRLYARGVEALVWQPLDAESFESRVARESNVAFGEFTDYRGVRVFGVARRITPAGDSLARKVDRDEALAGHRRRVALDCVLGSLLLLLLGSVMVALHRNAAARASQERVRQEEALRERDRQYRVLFEAAGDGIILIRDGRCVDCNQKALELFGCGREQLIGKMPSSLSPPQQANGQDSREAAEEKRRLALDGQTLQFEWQHRRCDGTPFEAEITLSRLDITGEPHLLAMVRDVTEHKRAEEEIRQRNRELRAIGDLVTATATNLELQMVLDRAVRGVMELTGLEGGTLCLVDQSTQSLKLAAQINTSPQTIRDLTTSVIKVGDCLCGNCAKTCEPFILWDNASGSEFATREAQRNEGIRFHAAFPLCIKGGCIGVLCIFARSAARPTDRALAIVHDLCGPIALAIENARLYEAANRELAERQRAEEALRRRAAFDQLMTKILARFATCAWPEVDASIVSALQAIAEFTGADHGYVIMFSAHRTTWRATHEWCGPHVPPRLQEYQNIKFGTQAWSESRLLADEIIRFNSMDELPPEVWAERQHYKAEGVLSALDVPIKAATGVVEGCVGLHSSARPIAWSDTDVAHVRMVGDAIATAIERKRVEEALRESEQRYKDFISQSNEGVWRLELDQPIPIDLPHEEGMRRVLQYGYLAECNVAFAHLLGFSTAEELLGRRPRDLMLAPEGRSESNRPPDQGGLQAQTVEIHGYDRAGNHKHLLRTQIPIVENGMLVRAWGILHDFTELRQAEEELRKSEKRWRAVFENSAVGIALTDCITAQFQVANLAFQKMVGYKEDELRAMTFMDITHEDDRERNRQLLSEILEGKRQSFSMEKRYRRKDGSLIWVNLHVSLVPGTERIPRFSLAIVEDITERKQAEEALRESEQLFRRLSEASFEGIIFAEAGNVVDANPRMADMLGCRLQDLIGAKIAELVAPESREVVQAHIRAGSDETYEHKARRKDGSIFPVEARGAAVFWKGRLVRATVIRDITERKRAEEALRGSEARFRTLITEARVAMGVARNGITLFVNTEYVKLFGLQNPEETIGRPILDQHAPQCHEWMKDMIRRGQQGLPTPADFESVGRRKDGSTFPMHCAVSHISLADGPVTLGFLTDLTERKRAEETLRERERRYRLLFENNEAGVALATLDDRLLDCNEVMASMFGYKSREDMLSQEVWSFYVDPSDRRLLAEKLKREGRLVGGKLRCRKKDGTHVWVLYSASLIPEEGKAPNLVQVTAIDISGLEQAEQELQRSFEQLRALAARLESIREEERKRVAREIHDQLGQALTAIKIDLSSLVRELPAGAKQPAKKAASILKLVDESILTVRRISTELRPGMLDDLGLVATIEWAGEEFEARTGTACRLDLPREDIAVDPEQATAIFRIFQETLTNVARHADASRVEVRLAREDGDLTLEIHDNGKGIPEDKLSDGESLGILGMRERATLLGGDLTISSPAGNGTTVRVRIPEAHRT